MILNTLSGSPTSPAALLKPGQLPPLDEVLASAQVVSIPLRVRFRGIDRREALLLHGPAGWGEFSPFTEYDDAEASRWLRAGIEEAFAAKPFPVRRTVPVNATVPASVAPDDVAEHLAAFDGARTAKVKVAEPGQDLAADIDRVAATRSALGPAGKIRIDANGRWTVDEAVAAVTRLSRYGLEYVEQPTATVEDLAATRRALAAAGVDVLVAADESIRRAEDPLRVRRLEAADVVVLKAAPLGGARFGLAVAERVGLPVVVSSALDTSIGIAAGVALAAALPKLSFACGLGTVNLLAGDVVRTSVVPRGGVIDVRGTLGRLGSSAAPADPELLDRWAAPVERREWWLDRLRRCYRWLAGGGR